MGDASPRYPFIYLQSDNDIPILKTQRMEGIPWRYVQRVVQVVALGHTCKDLKSLFANYMSTFSPYHRMIVA